MKAIVFFLVAMSILQSTSSSYAQVNWIRNGIGGSNIVYSPDGTKLATGGDNLVTVWDLETLKPLTIFDIPQDSAWTSQYLSFSSGGDSLYVSRGNQRFFWYIWDIPTSKIVKQDRITSIPTYEQVAYHERKFAYGGEHNKGNVVFTGDAEQGVTDSLVTPADVVHMQFFPSGERLVARGGDSVIRIWDMSTKFITAQFKIDPLPSSINTSDPANYIYPSDPANVVCVLSSDSSLRIYNASDGSLKYELPEKSPIWHYIRIAPSPSSPLAAMFLSVHSSSYQYPVRDSMVTILDLSTGAILAEILVDHIVRGVTFSPKGDQFAVLLRDGPLLLYSTSTWQVIDTLVPESSAPYAFTFSKKSADLLVAGRGVQFIDVGSGGLHRTVHPYSTWGISLSPSEKYLATSSYIWDIENDTQAFHLQGEAYKSNAGNIHFLTDSTFFYTYRWESPFVQDCGSYIGCGRIVSSKWIATTLEGQAPDDTEFSLAQPVSGTSHVAAIFAPWRCDLFLPQTKKLISLLSSVCGGDTVFTYAPKEFYGTSMAFDNIGSRMLTASSDSLFLWDLTDGNLLGIFTGHSGACKPIGFSHNGIYFFSFGVEDSSIRVWDVGLGVNVKTYKPYLLSPSIAARAPDGKNIIVGYRDGTLLSLYVGDALSTPRVQPNQSGLRISCSPNPITTNSAIRFSSDRREPLKIELYNALGAKAGDLFEGTVSEEEQTVMLSDVLRLQSLSDGVYLISATTPQERKTLIVHLMR